MFYYDFKCVKIYVILKNFCKLCLKQIIRKGLFQLNIFYCFIKYYEGDLFCFDWCLNLRLVVVFFFNYLVIQVSYKIYVYFLVFELEMYQYMIGLMLVINIVYKYICYNDNNV